MKILFIYNLFSHLYVCILNLGVAFSIKTIIKVSIRNSFHTEHLFPRATNLRLETTICWTKRKKKVVFGHSCSLKFGSGKGILLDLWSLFILCLLLFCFILFHIMLLYSTNVQHRSNPRHIDQTRLTFNIIGVLQDITQGKPRSVAILGYRFKEMMSVSPF
jgi:hypothetical protein